MLRKSHAGVLLAIALLAGCGRPPQMGLDREAFQTVDAMFTAVGIQEVEQLDRCLSKLKSLEELDRLPTPAFRELSEIAEEAKGGGWESAERRLRDFMRGQRR